MGKFIFNATVSIIIAAIYTSASAQLSDRKPLVVGDALPIKEIKGMINYPKSSLQMADVKAKLIILDFWATTCSACVLSWPKLLALQKEFGSDLQIILMNRYETAEKIKPFLEKRKRILGVSMDLPMSCRDTTLWDIFPKRGLPVIYWIDANRNLVSIARGSDLTADNIRRALSNDIPKMRQFIDVYKLVDYKKPIYVDGNGGVGNSDAFLWSSSLTKWVPDVRALSWDFINEDGKSGLLASGSAVMLYKMAFNRNFYPPDGDMTLLDNEVELVGASLSASPDQSEGLNKIQYYTYQLLTDGSVSREGLLTLMRQDLQRYFGYEAFYKKVTKPSLILSMMDQTKVRPPKGSEEVWLSETEGTIDSVTVKRLIWFMRQATSYYRYLEYPILDETGYNGLLGNISIEGNCLDYKQLDKFLRKYGLKLALEPREIEVLVLKSGS